MEQKDWTGNKTSTITTIGAHNNSTHERENLDYYATHPSAVEMLLQLEDFNNVWECACGERHLANVLENQGKLKLCTDIVDRIGHGIEIYDFLNGNRGGYEGDIITNPPYRHANKFILKALELVRDGDKVAMFLPVRYLEGKQRKKLFQAYPPKTIYVSSSRIKCAMNGDFSNMTGSAVCYCWFVWQKGHKGDTAIKWFN